jgi:protein-tyrosine-phosphatase
VLPSLHEGIPMALLEAMALRRPVVATSVGGVPEVVQDHSNGLLAEPGDEQALAARCLELACDSELAHAIGATARRTVEQEFSQEANGAAVLETYRAVCGSHARIRRPGTLAFCRQLARGSVLLAWRRARVAIDSALERRRMTRIRREPGALRAALRSAGRILIVCHGNIIRSPFAAFLVAQGVADRGRVSIASAGLAAVPGKPPHPTALQLASALSVDLSAHTASPVAPEAVATSDAIFVMDVPQLVLMRERFPEARSKTFLLTCLASDTPLEIRDPYAGDESQFQACFDHITRAVQPIVRELSEIRA